MSGWTLLVWDRRRARTTRVSLPPWAPWVALVALGAVTALAVWVGLALGGS